MEDTKSAESTGLSSGENTAERATAKNEETHQKVTLPTFEKRGKLGRRRFTQCIKMRQNIDLNVMTNNREILQEHRMSWYAG